jgi:hypothetical protein
MTNNHISYNHLFDKRHLLKIIFSKKISSANKNKGIAHIHP